MANPWGAFRAKLAPITDERRKQLRDALLRCASGEQPDIRDLDPLARLGYIESGKVTTMGHEFLAREEKMDQYMATYWPK